MYVLGIETSCDETSASIVKNGRKIFSCQTSSSLRFHKRYGGIIPEIASRMQLETITCVVDLAVKEAGIKLKDVSLVSVTNGPGLLGSLVVGVSFAKSISLSLGIPLLAVDHIYSHIYSCFLNTKIQPLHCVALVVSGGHTSLFYVEDFDKMQLLGSTHDDASGEAFDKVAKILGLGYPGGPFIEKISKTGNPKQIIFKCSGTKNPLDFSFSGIKTAVLYLVKKRGFQAYTKQDIAASFQEAVINALVGKSILACELKGVDKLLVGGGVAANNRLRQRFYQEAQKKNIKVYFPTKALCMDNAAMVAGLGYQLFRKGYASDLDLNTALN